MQVSVLCVPGKLWSRSLKLAYTLLNKLGTKNEPVLKPGDRVMTLGLSASLSGVKRGVWGLELSTDTTVRLTPGTRLLGTEIGVSFQGFWLLCEQLLGSGL